MIRTIFFDLGGTLDGSGGHWLERFLRLYRAAGLELPRETIRGAFDFAERRAATDDEIASANFAQMVALHVRWQLEHLGLPNESLAQTLVAGFVEPVRPAVAENVRLLRELHTRGFTLGVISNGCGNVAALCEDFGYAPFLALTLDSRRLGLSKPDPAIYRHAVAQLGGETGSMLMVGDSLERDILPAKSIGLQTAWLDDSAMPSDPAVDFRLRTLAELPALLR